MAEAVPFSDPDEIEMVRDDSVPSRPSLLSRVPAGGTSDPDEILGLFLDWRRRRGSSCTRPRSRLSWRSWGEGGQLFYQCEGRPKYRLLPLSPDTFLLEGMGTFRVRFVADGNGRVTKMVGLYAEGQEDESPRDP